jgi:putative ABC transport system permease protein
MPSPIRNWLRAVFRRGTLDREMRAEMRAHLDLATQRFVARGMSLAAARYAARVEFGNVAVLEEEGRDARGAAWIDSVIRDVGYALRSLRASPAFATVAVLSLGIGIGANTAIFSLIDAVMLKSLPIERPGELVRVMTGDSTRSINSFGGIFTNPMWEALRDRTSRFAAYATSGGTEFNLASGGEARPVAAAWVNGDFFNTLGVRPELGRLLAPADDYRGCPATVVVSHGFWQSELGGRRDVIGKPISLTSVPYTVLGVAPEGFFGVDVGSTTQLYVPICAEPFLQGKQSALDKRSNWWIRVIARPRHGVSATELDTRIRSVARAVYEATVPPTMSTKNRADYVTRSFGLAPAGNGISDVRRQYSRALMTLMGMVGIILLISCANVANLLLARGAARGREVAIRIAIGASRARLIRQLLTESGLLAILGAALGILVAVVGSRMLVNLLAGDGPNRVVLDLSLDLRVMAFTVAVSVVTVVLCGLAPAWRATRVDPQSAMKAGGRGTIDGHSRFRAGKALVVAQSALALILVIGAGLLVGSFRRLSSVDPGFQSDGVLMVSVDFQRTSMPRSQYIVATRQLLDRFRTIPGVRSASETDLTPVGGSSWNDVLVTPATTGLSERERLSWFNKVSDGYFRTLGTRLIAGRDFDSHDTPSGPAVAIINQAVAKKFFPGLSPIGQTYRTDDNGHLSPPVTVVGVVEDSKYLNLREKPQPIVFLAASQDSMSYGWTKYAISMSGPPAAVVGSVKAVASGYDPRISLSFTNLSDVTSRSLQRERLLAILSGFFGSLALALAMIGLYGVMAYTVARRRVEIGIRIALGAARSRVVRLVLGDVGRLIGAGILLGGIGAVVATRLLAGFLFGVDASDPITIAAAAAILAVAALVAGAIPARRAAKLEPVEALRED